MFNAGYTKWSTQLSPYLAVLDCCHCYLPPCHSHLTYVFKCIWRQVTHTAPPPPCLDHPGVKRTQLNMNWEALLSSTHTLLLCITVFVHIILVSVATSVPPWGCSCARTACYNYRVTMHSLHITSGKSALLSSNAYAASSKGKVLSMTALSFPSARRRATSCIWRPSGLTNPK